MQPEYDVAILGGGLAGLSASILLARQGYQVLLLEKQRYPVHKVCGEYLSQESWSCLAALGLPLAEWALPRLTQFRLTTSRGGNFQTALPLGGFGLSRYTLDDQLARIAIATGVELRMGEAATAVSQKAGQYQLQSKRGSYTARLAVGAFGKRSGLEQQLARTHRRRERADGLNFVGVKYHVAADLPSDRIELHTFPQGYCGISQVEGKDRFCLCYMTTARQLKRYGGIAGLERGLLSQNATLQRYLADFPRHFAQPATISNIDFARRRNPEGGLLMAGDAAGLIAPLTGNGMSMALHAGAMLATHLPSYLSGQAPYQHMAAAYARAWQAEFGRRLWAGRQLQQRFFNERALHASLPLFKALPALARRLIRLTHGRPFTTGPDPGAASSPAPQSRINARASWG
jgi:flavin-dependent dehydrogenase